MMKSQILAIKIYYFKGMLELLPYKKELDSRLDNFVFQESVNGTFLQSRLFLNYHPENRFRDESFALERSGTIAAYFPGNVTSENEFVSHQGSTFGGPIFSKAFYSAGRVMEALKFADQYFASKYKKVRLKITPALFAKESPDLIEYTLEHLGYTRHTELSSYTPLVDVSGNPIKDPLANCEKDCRRIFRISEKFDVTYRAFNAGHSEGKASTELLDFYKFLEISKAKHNVRPVHSIEELQDLQKRLSIAATADTTADGRTLERLRFRGIWQGERYVASMMLFAFPETGTLHAQYISPDDSFKEFHPTTTLYVNAMREAAQEGFRNFSWGISTEDSGSYLNENLIKYKESLGAKACVNVTYTKEF